MNGTGATLGFLAGLSVAGMACAARGSRARPDEGVDAATVRTAMYRSSQKHAGTGRDARLAERQVPDFDQLAWTLEDVRPNDDRLCQVSGCSERDVAAYARRMVRGEVPPPVVLVARDGDNGFECVDGSHRVEAAQRAELDTIPAYVGRPARRGRAGKSGSRAVTRSLSIQGHVIPVEDLQYVLENEGFTADDAYYDEMARIMNDLIFPLRVYRGLAIKPGGAVREDDLRAGSGWWTWNREVAVHFARGTHNGSESGGEAWLASGIVPSSTDVTWWSEHGDPSAIEQYLRFSSPYVEARFTDDSLILRKITRVTVRRLP